MDVLDPQHLAECLARYIREGQARDARESAWASVIASRGGTPGAPGQALAQLIEDAVARVATLRIAILEGDALRLVPFVLLDAALLLVCTTETKLGDGEAARAALIEYLQQSRTPSFPPAMLPFGPACLEAVAKAEEELRRTRPELTAAFGGGGSVAVGTVPAPARGDN